MTPRKRILTLITIMSCLVIAAVSIAVGFLYRTALSEERARLKEAAKSQARLIESVARFDAIYSKDYPQGPRQATLDQIQDAHARYQGFGETGEFTLSAREGDNIVFLLSHRHLDLNNPQPVPWESKLAEPMRQALSGKSGTIIGLDYRGETVLAAHEPIQGLNLGIVAKIDLSEIRAPFIRAILTSALFSVFFIAIGIWLFRQVTEPLLTKLQNTVRSLEKALDEVNTLRGILPICAYCKKIRDDNGYWNQVEVYIKQRLDTQFSHGICPDCMKEHHPREYEAALKKKR